MNRTTWRIPALLVAIALILAACGGTDDTTTTGPTTETTAAGTATETTMADDTTETTMADTMTGVTCEEPVTVGVVTDLSGPVPFKVERMREGALEGADPEAVAAFWQRCAKLQRATSATSMILNKTLTRVDAIRANAAADWHDATPAEMTIPSTLADERATNPFMRVSDAAELGRRRTLKDGF